MKLKRATPWCVCNRHLSGFTRIRCSSCSALQNLIANALKFVEPGRTPEVAISTWRVDGNRIRITIRDNGVGIDPAWQHKIFGVFQRAHSADEFPGTGIGLAMVKRIVDLLNGEVGVTSVPGKGSTFWLELPVAPAIDL